MNVSAILSCDGLGGCGASQLLSARLAGAKHSVLHLVVVLLVLSQVQKVAYLFHVGLDYDCRVVEVSLLLLGLLRQNVTVISVLSFQLSCSGQLEAFLRAGICLNFWHFLFVV